MEQSNIRVTTKVAVNALLGDTPTLQEYGSAIMHNLGTKEVNSAVRIFNSYENKQDLAMKKIFILWRVFCKEKGKFMTECAF